MPVAASNSKGPAAHLTSCQAAGSAAAALRAPSRPRFTEFTGAGRVAARCLALQLTFGLLSVRRAHQCRSLVYVARTPLRAALVLEAASCSVQLSLVQALGKGGCKWILKALQSAVRSRASSADHRLRQGRMGGLVSIDIL